VHPPATVLIDDAVYEHVLRSVPTETQTVRDHLDGRALAMAALEYCPQIGDSGVDAFVAGGFVRDVIARTAPRDLDVYARTHEGASELESRLRHTGWILDRMGMISTSWRDKRGHVVQIIKTDVESADECIRRFDLTICCASIDLRTQETFCGTTFVEDLNNRRLVINRPAFPIDTLRRVARFVSEGYAISSEQLLVLHGCILRELHSQGLNAFRPSELL
jgi:hypothetical protein